MSEDQEKEAADATIKKQRWDNFFDWVAKIDTMMNDHINKQIQYFLTAENQFINLKKYICNFLGELKPDIEIIYKSRIVSLGLSKKDYEKYTKHAYAVLDDSIKAAETKIRKALQEKEEQKEKAEEEKKDSVNFYEFLSEFKEILAIYIAAKEKLKEK